MKFKIPIPPQLYNILSIIRNAQGAPRLVGGCVRDAILNSEEARDIDIVTILPPNELMTLCTTHQIKFRDTGSKYGTITLFAGNMSFEATTLRRDTNCDGRHTTPIFTTDFMLDAKRRDFTINAMSYCPFEEELFDYCGGYQDLKDKRLVFIGDPAERIKEDYLRILRFFRFSDRFAKNLDEASLKACIENKGLLSYLSKERIVSELTKLVSSKTCHKAFDIMIKYEILSSVIPLKLSTTLLTEINLNTPPPLTTKTQTKLAALFIENPIASIAETLKQLHFPRQYTAEIKTLCAFYKVHHLITSFTLDQIKETFFLLWIEGEDMMQYIIISCAWQNSYFPLLKTLLSPPPKCPIDGNHPDLKGIEGAEIKRKLQKLKLEWIKNNL